MQRSLPRSDRLDGSTDRSLRTKGKEKKKKKRRCSLNKAHYQRPFLLLVQSITLASKCRFSHRTNKKGFLMHRRKVSVSVQNAPFSE